MKPTMLHFHNGHSLEVWCGRRSALANWTTVAAWVTCSACLRMIHERSDEGSIAKDGRRLKRPQQTKVRAAGNKKTTTTRRLTGQDSTS